MFERLKSSFAAGKVEYKCFMCNENIVETYQGECPECLEKQHQHWLRQRDIEIKKDDRQRQLNALIDRVPELIELLDKTA